MRDRRAALRRAIPLVLVASLLSLAAAGCRVVRVDEAGAVNDEPVELRAGIASMLAASAEAWNRGDIEGFMADYQRSPHTTYIGSSGLLVGWEAIRERYAPLFEPGAKRDSLRFEGLRVRELGARHALATARYVLEADGERTASGPFTLVLLRMEGRWRIVHDHSSSDPPDRKPSEGS